MFFAIKRLLLIDMFKAIVFIVIMLYGNCLHASGFVSFTDAPWIKHLAGQDVLQHSFTYPVNEIDIHINLNPSISANRAYTLSAYIPDLYHLFCLKEVLKQQKIKYYLKKKNNDVKLLVYLSKKQNIELLLKSFKTYRLKIKILSKQEEK